MFALSRPQKADLSLIPSLFMHMRFSERPSQAISIWFDEVTILLSSLTKQLVVVIVTNNVRIATVSFISLEPASFY